MKYDDLYAPLLSDAEITRINSEREERAVEAATAQMHWRNAIYGGCGCAAALPECNCGMQSWLEPSRSARPSEESHMLRDLVLVVMLITVIAAVIWGVL